MTPAIFGLAGPELTADERAFFADAKPAGYILFGRNVVDRAQVRALTDGLRALEGRDDVLISIDQEGGRVARMRPPEWPAFPPPGAFESLYDIAPISGIEAVRANARALGLMLGEVGINVDCLPLLDVRSAETHQAIGDRSFGSDPLLVAALGRAVIDGLREGGVVGVVKHMPGQGRAAVDSHHHLPTVTASAEELARDLLPFQRLADAPMGMTGHIVFDAWDATQPATMSSKVIQSVIRETIGFDGFLMSDDLDMKALSGSVADRAAGCVAAGCDIALNCWGRMDEMVAIADILPEMTARGRERLDAAMATIGPVDASFDDAIAKRDALLALV
jgi:beta-N-acetylhexosaminidase